MVASCKFKFDSHERGHGWETVAKNLNDLAQQSFKVDMRAV